MFSMNHVCILSDRALAETEVSKIKGIFAESSCVNESMIGTFGDAYKGISNDEKKCVLSLNGGEPYLNTVIEY